MDYYDKLGVPKLINAWDHLTFLGGSLMPDSVLEAMKEAAECFVPIRELHVKAGERIAQLTHNEAAYVTPGAAAGMAIAVSACITGCDPAKIDSIPNLEGLKNEVIIHRSQRNGYDHSVRQAGVELVEIGNAEITHPWQLAGAITPRTACIFYFASSLFQQGTLPLAEIIEIGKRHQVPVVVDAAAQLPPVENLWQFTELGADAVVFSGGKVLGGPQSSGFIVGKRSIIEACRLNASPNYSAGRSMKIGKEEIIGLVAALERYLELDHQQLNLELENKVAYVLQKLVGPNIQAERLYPGPTGQDYPRALIKIGSKSTVSAAQVQERLAQGRPRIMVGLAPQENAIIINPYNVTQSELELVIRAIQIELDK